jgi:hypothetical protein
MAVGQDAFYPGAADAPPMIVERFLARFVDRAVETGAAHPRAPGALLDVMSLGKPATRPFSPALLIPILFGPKKPRLTTAPLTDAERKTTVA